MAVLRTPLEGPSGMIYRRSNKGCKGYRNKLRLTIRWLWKRYRCSMIRLLVVISTHNLLYSICTFRELKIWEYKEIRLWLSIITTRLTNIYSRMGYKIWMLSMYIIWDMLSSIITLKQMRKVWVSTRVTTEMSLKLLSICIMLLIRARWVHWMHLLSCIYTVNTIQWVGNGLWSKM